MGGFSLLLASLKAFLEHGIELNVVASSKTTIPARSSRAGPAAAGRLDRDGFRRQPCSSNRRAAQRTERLLHCRSEPVRAECGVAAASGLDMCITCAHAVNMSKMIQIRHVPDGLHRKLKARAAMAGQSLSDYLLAEIERLAGLPTRAEMLARIHSRSRVRLKIPAAIVIRKERESA
jgi:hypothetical protein